MTKFAPVDGNTQTLEGKYPQILYRCVWSINAGRTNYLKIFAFLIYFDHTKLQTIRISAVMSPKGCGMTDYLTVTLLSQV